MEWTIRPAAEQDLPRILEIYDHARQYMAQTGNPNQWGKTNPPRETLEADITQRNLHVVEENGEIIGVFEDNKIVLRKIAPHEKGWFTEKVIETSAPTFGHAGGDIALIESFVDILMGKAPDFRACNLESASDAYRIAFAAEDAMNEGRTVWL